MTGPWWFVSGLFFGAAITLKVTRWAFGRAIEKARVVAMAKVSRVFAETMAQLYPDVPVTWAAMVEQETYEMTVVSAMPRKDVN